MYPSVHTFYLFGWRRRVFHFQWNWLLPWLRIWLRPWCEVFYFLLPIYWKKVLFWGQDFEMEICRFWETLNSKITYLTFGLCVFVCLCVCYQHNSKQITAEISNLVFYICIIYRCFLKLSIKIRQKLCEQGYTLQPMDRISC